MTDSHTQAAARLGCTEAFIRAHLESSVCYDNSSHPSCLLLDPVLEPRLHEVLGLPPRVRGAA